jgi:quercetin dioxygenase-like cupin family protein
MSRKTIDCRNFPGECAMTLSGPEEELLEAGVEHMISVHRAADGPELRRQVQTAMSEETLGAVQTAELELIEGWSATDPSMHGRFDFPIHAETGAASSSVVYFELAPGDHCGMHTYSAEEVALIHAGEAEVEVAGARTRLTAGGLGLVPGFAPHDVRNVGSEPLKVVGFFSAAAVVTKFDDVFEPLGTSLFVIGAPQPQEATA